MTSRRWYFAFIFIAISALATWAMAENVYKCGNTYSQVPCPGGKQVNVDDSRDPQQKKLKDEITQRDAALAKTMEADRLASEQALRAAEAKRPVTKKARTEVEDAQEEPILIKPKRFHHKTVKQLGFVAEVPGSRHQPTKKKRAKQTGPETRP
jgi:hypothetical protein